MKRLKLKGGSRGPSNGPETNGVGAHDDGADSQRPQVFSREAMEMVLNGQSEINDTLKEQMLDLLELVVQTHLTPETVEKAYYDLWCLKGEIEDEVWDKILGAVLGLKPGEPTDFALAFEDRDQQAKADAVSREASAQNGSAEAPR